MASATWLANPSLLMLLPMVPGDSGVISLKKHCLLALPFAEIVVYKLLGQISSYYLCLWVGGLVCVH